MINWGIIGCGNVTEVKSGPAFNKVKDSKLIAVMSRDAIWLKIMQGVIMSQSLFKGYRSH